MSELASTFGVHPVQITQWRKQALAELREVFTKRLCRGHGACQQGENVNEINPRICLDNGVHLDRDEEKVKAGAKGGGDRKLPIKY